MKGERTILEVLFPKVRAELLRILFESPHKERHVRELMNKTGLALSTVQEELRILRGIGLITSRSNGYRRFYRSNRDHELFPELMRLVHVSERLPRTKDSLLRRQRRIRRRTPRHAHLPSTYEPNWHLFSKERKT